MRLEFCKTELKSYDYQSCEKLNLIYIIEKTHLENLTKILYFLRFL